MQKTVNGFWPFEGPVFLSDGSVVDANNYDASTDYFIDGHILCYDGDEAKYWCLPTKLMMDPLHDTYTEFEYAEKTPGLETHWRVHYDVHNATIRTTDSYLVTGHFEKDDSNRPCFILDTIAKEELDE